ncbi:2-methylcitrate dehydratase protein [Rutstroemia sp. NJR-2017a BBW]|nr:2-methylcitrate dehydratase protein [Rutstroemia sp. NJR-2017a BBW]
MASPVPNTEVHSYDQILIDIVQYVYHTKIDSPRAYERARIALLDALGCAVETLSVSPECVAMIGPTVPGTIVPNGFHLPGTSHVLDPIKGAFDMGAMIRYLDHNDAYPGAEWGHPSDNLGAILAIADWQSRTRAHDAASPHGISLHKLLTAHIKAYEIQGVFQIANAFNEHGLDHTILVKVASTAVTSYLLDLTEQQALAALSQAWQWGFYHTMLRDKEIKIVRPYKSWVMETVFFKLIPAEGHAISAAEAAVTVAQQLTARGLSAEKHVKSVRIRTQKPAFTIVNKEGPLHNAADRDHCLQYIVAVIMLKGTVIETADYMNESPWAQDPRVDLLREKMVVVEDEGFTRDYHDQKVRSGANAILVELTNGEFLEDVVVEFPVGHPKSAETLPKVRAKFRENMAYKFQSGEVDNILRAVESDDMPVHEFVDLFVR